MNYSPVALFTYNRPAHTRKTLEALALNPESPQTELFIYADGPKPDATKEDHAKINEVRQIIREQAWCGQVHFIEAETNRGLATSIVEGVRAILAQAGTAIVLEDDLQVAQGFLRYMNDALRCYENEPQVMHVSGYMFPVRAKLPETFFLQLGSSWGWATWKRAFEKYQPNAAHLRAELERRCLLTRFNLDGAYDYTAQLSANADGRLRTWAVQWHATLVLQEALALYPRQTLVENHGFDGTGTHCRRDPRFLSPSTGAGISVVPAVLEESKCARQAVRRFLQPPWTDRLRNRLGKTLGLHSSCL